MIDNFLSTRAARRCPSIGMSLKETQNKQENCNSAEDLGASKSRWKEKWLTERYDRTSTQIPKRPEYRRLYQED
jgi:hypothetical protein